MYGDNVDDHSKPDFRNLLFWEPTINISGTESKEITFYTSDLPGKYIGVIQGVSNNRNLGNSKTSFGVNEKIVLKNYAEIIITQIRSKRKEISKVRLKIASRLRKSATLSSGRDL